MVKNLVRVCIGEICYLRDIFPKDCFAQKDYCDLDIHRLRIPEENEDGTVSFYILPSTTLHFTNF